METAPITNYAQLQERIRELGIYKTVQEKELKLIVNEAISLLDFTRFFKQNRNEQPFIIVKSAVNMVLNQLVDVVLGKNRSVKGFISSIVVEHFTTSLVNNNLISIVSNIAKLYNFIKKPEHHQSN